MSNKLGGRPRNDDTNGVVHFANNKLSSREAVKLFLENLQLTPHLSAANRSLQLTQLCAKYGSEQVYEVAKLIGYNAVIPGKRRLFRW